MARRYPSSPKLLLSMVSAVITAFAVIYGVSLGWFSIYMLYLYIFIICYCISVCKGNRIATAYTAAGAVTSIVFLLAVKFLDPILGTMIGIATAFFVAFMTDVLVKCDWRYLSFNEFDFSSFPVERSIQFKYDQHAPAVEAKAKPPTPEVKTPEKEEVIVDQPKQRRKSARTPLSRKEKKAEAKKQKIEGKKS